MSLEKHAAEFDRHNFVQRIANDKLIAKGILHFEAFYDENYGLTILRSKNIPELNNRVDSTRVTDSLMSDTYELKIELKDASVLPQVFEIGNRIKRKPKDHIYENGEVCVAFSGKIREAFTNDFNVRGYILDFLIPRFYAQSYYRKKKSWPWGEHSHDPVVSFFEWLSEKDFNDARKAIAIDHLAHFADNNDLRHQFAKSMSCYGRYDKKCPLPHHGNSKKTFHDCVKHSHMMNGIENMRKLQGRSNPYQFLERHRRVNTGNPTSHPFKKPSR